MQKIYLLLFTSLVSLGLSAQTIIAGQNFEAMPTTPTLTLAPSGSATNFGTMTGGTASGDRPATSPYFSDGTTGYRVNNGSVTLTSDAVNTSGFTDVSFSLRLASFSLNSTGNGADGTDLVTVSISPDNGVTYYSRIIVGGNSNAYWSFAGGAGVAAGTYGTTNVSTPIVPSGGGSRTADGYSTVTITGLPSVAQLRISINLLNNAANEAWAMDEVKIFGTPVALPVNVTSILATKTATGNVLSWKVATETNFKEYVLEKSVGNSSNFKSVATVSATQLGSYSLTDAQPAGYNYYRLKLVDRDGKSSYSKTVLVINETKGFAISNVYPTVTTGAVVIESYAATPVKATIRVVNQVGQSVYTQTTTLAQAGLTNVNLSLLARGNYLMQVITEGYSKTFKIVKQ